MITRLLLSLLLLGATSSLMAMEKKPQDQEAVLNKVAQELLKINSSLNAYVSNRELFNEQKKRNDLSQLITTTVIPIFLPLINDLKGDTSLKETLGRAVATVLAYNEQDADTAQSNINTLKTTFSQAQNTISHYIKAPQAKIVRLTEETADITFDKPLSDQAKNLIYKFFGDLRQPVTITFTGATSAQLEFPILTGAEHIVARLNIHLINQPLLENQLVRTFGSVSSDSGNQMVIKFNKVLTQDQKNKIINFFNQQSTKHQLTFSTDNTEITITKDPYHSAQSIAEFINEVALR
jgi:hypothetical protein